MLYIGSDNELAVTEYPCDETQLVRVRELDWEEECDYSPEDDIFANNTLTKKYKYSVDPIDGCACSFTFDFDSKPPVIPKILRIGVSKKFLEESENERQEWHKQGKRNLENLFEYLKLNIQNDHCELLSFWTGNFEIKDKITMDLRNFVFGDSFKFSDGQHITVVK